MANRVSYGLNNVHYAVITRAADGTITYGTPKRLPGAVSLAITPTGDATNFYADNGIYFSINSNTGYEGTLSVAIITEDFKKEVLGEEVINNMLVEKSNAKQNDFALLFEVDGDSAADKFVYYDVTAARPAINAATTAETIEITPNELTVTIKPRITDKAVKAIASAKIGEAGSETDNPVYKDFFTEVVEPEDTP